MREAWTTNANLHHKIMGFELFELFGPMLVDSLVLGGLLASCFLTFLKGLI
jgi:hypothetical protein